MVELLEDIESFKLHVRNLQTVLKQFNLTKFPQMMKNLRVLIEFNDCIIQANDFLTHQIISDDNTDRFQAYQNKIITEITKS